MDFYYKDVSPPARAAYATIKHLGINVNLKELACFEETRSEKFVKLNPAHQVPMLVDNGFVLTESRAIMCYLVNKYSPNHSIYPADPMKRAEIDRMLYFDGTNLFPTLRETFIVRCIHSRKPSREQEQAVHNVIDELIAMKSINKFLASNEVSLADISVAMNYEFIKTFFPEDGKKLQAWYKNVEVAVPAVKEINDSVDFTIYKQMLNI